MVRDHLWAPSCYHGSVSAGWDVDEKYISAHNIYEHNINTENRYIQARKFVRGIPVCDSCNIVNMDIQHKVGDTSDLQSGGGTAGAAGWLIYAQYE